MFKYALVALATSGALTAPAFAENSNTNTNPAPAVIANTVDQVMSLAPSQSLTGNADNQLTVKQAGAAFIKVHFSYFNLPEGAYVTVSDPLGKENYRYDGSDNKKATYDSAAGENGLTQFSAMSVFGDTAIVKLVMPEDAVWEKQHGIKIDRFNAGTENQVADQFAPIQSLTGPTPSSTCGVNERRDVACWQSSHPTEYERTRPVARLLMSGSGLCTGWCVGENNHMFTNEHCVSSQSELSNTEIWFNYQASSCGGTVNDSQVVKVTGKDLLASNYNLDYTLFTVNNFASIASFGNFGLENRAPQQGERIYIAQHGSGNPKELAIESDQNSNGLCQIDVASATGRAAGVDTGYFCDTIGGSSGSPVLAANTNKVIALHHFGGCENQGVRIDKIWPQVSSHFGGVPPVGDGGGPIGNQAPVAQISASCNGLSCTFNGSGSVDPDGSITDYSWNLGDGTTLNGANVSHTYAANGNYNVSLTVTDNEGATGTASESVAASDGAAGELTDGVAKTNLSGAKDQETDYFFQTTENNTSVVITMSGGSGDADLYVRRGAVPSKTTYDCRPYAAGNNESCTVNVGTPDTVYVKLIGYSAYSGVSLVANATVGTDPGNGFPKTGLSAAQGQWLNYTYDVPAGVSSITTSISGGTGDADLYTRKGVAPTTSAYDCRPYRSGNSESCTTTVTSGDVVHIGLRAYSAFSGVTLNVQ